MGGANPARVPAPLERLVGLQIERVIEAVRGPIERTKLAALYPPVFSSWVFNFILAAAAVEALSLSLRIP